MRDGAEDTGRKGSFVVTLASEYSFTLGELRIFGLRKP